MDSVAGTFNVWRLVLTCYHFCGVCELPDHQSAWLGAAAHQSLKEVGFFCGLVPCEHFPSCFVHMFRYFFCFYTISIFPVFFDSVGFYFQFFCIYAFYSETFFMDLYFSYLVLLLVLLRGAAAAVAATLHTV